MAERRWRWRTIIRWTLTIAIVIYAVADWGGDQEKPAPAEPSDEPGAAAALRITAISDADVNPGDAVVVSFDGAEGPAPIEARLARKPAQVIVREPGSVVIRIPNDIGYGKAALRLIQGERRTKSWDLHVRATNHRKLIGRLLGGLALFVFGLGMLATGARGLAGQRIRTLLNRITRSPHKAVAVGVLVGSVTQLTSSAAAFTVSLVEARLLALGPTIAVLVGAQLGASITGALIPVAFARESLLVIAIGVLWTRMSMDRRAHAVGQLILGAGLMLYGLHLLQTSVEPLVSDPKLLPYLGYLRTDDFAAKLVCAATGALLALVLQGPGPLYVLVVGLAQASGALPLANALAILAGASLGAAIGMALVAWQAGKSCRPLVAPHLAFGAAGTLLVLLSLPLWTLLGEAVTGHGEAVDYGHTVVQTNISTSLAVAFAASQIAVVAVWSLVLPVLIARSSHRAPPVVVDALPADAVAVAGRRELAQVLDRHRIAMEIALEISCASERSRSTEVEEALVEARREMEALYGRLQQTASSADLERLTRTTVAALQLQRVIEQLVHISELSVERRVVLTPAEQERLRQLYTIARESYDAVIAALESGTIDLEAAGAREIRMNLLEQEARSATVEPRRKNDSSSLRLGLAELVDSYEHVGNHLFRVANAISGDDDDELT
ncbi:MAG: Na/Pi cotransporter family protein [Myxococcales bacterium]|nr:Na/Pi cotransporter family protein [Myxococcales bacterium]